MSKFIAFTLLICVAALPLAWGDGPAAKPAPSAEKLIELLGDRDFRKRDAAVKQLEAMGVEALPALKKAMTHDDLEIRRRVNDLVPALELAVLLAPKRVTLDVKKKPIRQVLDEVSKQTGYKIETWVNNEGQLYDFQIDNQPFWQAIDHICNTTGLIMQTGYGDDRLRLNQQDGYVPHVYYDGPVRLVANSFNHHRNIDFSFLPRTPQGSRRTDNLSFSFTLFVEPRMPLLGMGTVKLTTAHDDQRVSMLMATPNGEAIDVNGGQRWTSRYGNGYRSYSYQTQVNLMKPSEKAQAVKLLQGTVPVLLLAKQSAETVTEKILEGKGKKAKVGTTSFVIDEVQEVPNKQYQIKMTITEESKDNTGDYTWINSLSQRIELHDAEGNKYQLSGNSWGGNTPNHAQVTYTYANPGGNIKLGPPSKLIYYNWSTIQHQVKFEFKDLPLP